MTFNCHRCPPKGATQAGREVLLHFHKKTGGGPWTHREGWAENVDDLGSWFGVAVNKEGFVIQLELQGDSGTQTHLSPKWTGNNVCGES